MAYNGMFGNLGLAFAPLLGGMINYLFGLQILYLVVAAMNLSGLYFLFTAPAAASEKTQEVVNKNTAVEENERRWLPFLILLAAMTMGGIVYRGTSVTLPAYFELRNIELFHFIKEIAGNLGTPNVVATVLTSLIYLIGMGGQYLGGRVGATRDLRWSYLVFHLITIPAAIGMALSANIPLFSFALIHGFFLLGMQPIENTLVARLTPRSMLSRAFGLKFIMTFGCGALSVKIIEIVKESYGMSAIYISLALVSVMLCMFAFTLTRHVGPMRG